MPRASIVDEPKILMRDGSEWIEGRDDPSLIKWIANEGARVSAIVARLKEAPLTTAQARLRDEMLQSDAPNPVEVASIAGRGSAQTRQTQSDAAEIPKLFTANHHGAISIQIPLNITVSLGTPAPIQIDSPRAVPVATVAPSGPFVDSEIDTSRVVSESEFLEVVADPDWTKRKGYIEDFLGVKFPLPKLSKGLEASTVPVPMEFRRPGNRFAIDYYNYTVVMNSDRCLAWYSAAVIDGDRRFVMPDRDDDWNIDPRLDDDPANVRFQCGEELYAAKSTDRGHLTRYLDVAFGDTKEEAIRAAKDTFYFTNCASQLQGFNRSQSRWQGIERFLLENKAKKEKRRIVVITGPIFREDDPFYTNEFMDYEIPAPLAFCKLCAIIRPDDTLSATAFVLKQDDVKGLPGFTESLKITSEIQITVADLEQRTGLNFEVFRDHDHLASGGGIGTLEIVRTEFGIVAENRLTSLNDIVV